MDRMMVGPRDILSSRAIRQVTRAQTNKAAADSPRNRGEGATGGVVTPILAAPTPRATRCGGLSPAPGPLENDYRFPKSLVAGRWKEARCGRRRESGALLVPMLLKRRMWL